MNKRAKLRIVGDPQAREERNTGRLMYESLRFLEDREYFLEDKRADEVSLIPGQRVVAWSAVKDLLEFLETNFTARDMSVRDQAAFMVAIASLVTGEAEEMPTTIEGAAEYITEPLGLKFDKEAALRWFSDSPDGGDPRCICSYCEEVITEEEVPPIRIFHDNKEMRLHRECFQTCEEYKLLPYFGQKTEK